MLFISLTVFLESSALFFSIVAPSWVVTGSCFPVHSPSYLSGMSVISLSFWLFFSLTQQLISRGHTRFIWLPPSYLTFSEVELICCPLFCFGPQAGYLRPCPSAPFYPLLCGGFLLDGGSPLSVPAVLLTPATQASGAQNREPSSLRWFWPQDYCILQ